MKLGPATKIDKRNKITSKKFDDDVMPANCDVIVILLINGKFRAIRKRDSTCIVCKSYFSLTVTFHLTKSENRTKKSLI